MWEPHVLEIIDLLYIEAKDRRSLTLGDWPRPFPCSVEERWLRGHRHAPLSHGTMSYNGLLRKTKRWGWRRLSHASKNMSGRELWRTQVWTVLSNHRSNT